MPNIVSSLRGREHGLGASDLPDLVYKQTQRNFLNEKAQVTTKVFQEKVSRVLGDQVFTKANSSLTCWDLMSQIRLWSYPCEEVPLFRLGETLFCVTKDKTRFTLLTAAKGQKIAEIDRSTESKEDPFKFVVRIESKVFISSAAATTWEIDAESANPQFVLSTTKIPEHENKALASIFNREQVKNLGLSIHAYLKESKLHVFTLDETPSIDYLKTYRSSTLFYQKNIVTVSDRSVDVYNRATGISKKVYEIKKGSNTEVAYVFFQNGYLIIREHNPTTLEREYVFIDGTTLREVKRCAWEWVKGDHCFPAEIRDPQFEGPLALRFIGDYTLQISNYQHFLS